MVNLSQDYLITIAPIPVFELLVNLEYSLPSLIEKKEQIQTDELWKQLFKREIPFPLRIPNNFPLDSNVCFRLLLNRFCALF